MKYLNFKLPDGELNVSKIVLGTDYFGTSVNQETAFELIEYFVEDGGNCLDTARFYADWMPGGHEASEKLLGAWLKSSKARDKVLISTKGGHPPLERMEESRLSRACVESDLDKSLITLGIEHIDIYWLHRDDIERPVEEIMETLGAIVATGKVRAVGCCNWKVDRIAAANAYAHSNGLPPLMMSQIQWSLAVSTAEAHGDTTKVIMDDTEYAGYLEQEVPVMAYSSQAKGFFARPLGGVNSINQKSQDWFYNEENLLRLERVKAYAAQTGLTPNTVALGYILCNRLPAMALVGCRSIEQLKSTLAAADVSIPEADLNSLIHPSL
jgi:aryl-alcohol dehydrogenase-like predicted oxidoreductase